ncbi:siderophore-iron reductase FhuF [Rhizobium sp.]
MSGSANIDFGMGADIRWRAANAAHFADFLALTDSKYAYCQSRIVLAPKEGSLTITCSDLANPGIFAGLMDRFATLYPNSDRRAVVSMWTLHYFSGLSIAMAVLGLEMKLLVPNALDQINLCMDPETAAPQAFQLPDLGHRVEGLGFAGALAPLLLHHVEPLIAAISHNERLGRRMLWTNVAAYLDWIVGEIGRGSDRANASEQAVLYRQEIWPGGVRNPLFGLIRSEKDEAGEIHGCRKVCCLRYSLPGVGGCGFSCPLPQGRQ